jgi:hypothetical protein
MTRRTTLVGGTAVLVLIAIGIIVAQGRGGNDLITPLLVDEAVAAGVNHVYGGEYPFFVGGGVATFDCNDDGKPEMYLAGGENPAALYVNESQPGGELRFMAKPSPATDLLLVTGAYPIDINSDGLLDLAVLRRGPNVLLRGIGNCGFQDATEEFGVGADNDWTVSFAATWEERATMPTLAFGSYLVPDTFDCAAVRLWRPTTTTGVSVESYDERIDLPAHCTLSLLFSDWNRDGGVDLRVSNDRNYDRFAREQLWRVLPGESPREYTAADGWRDLTIWGMGIASYDLTGDGKPELYLTSQADNKLQTLESSPSDATDAAVTRRPTYRDIALERGVTATRPYTGGDVLPSTGWHPEFDDINNDGYIDLFVSKGNVEGQIDYASFDPNNLLLGKPDGTFIERGLESGIANRSRSRGAAVLDLNLDGLLDLVVVNRRVPVEVRRNVGSGTPQKPSALGNWIAVRPRQPAPNVFAVGAHVEVRVGTKVYTREVVAGGGHASGDAGWIHFGVGSATSVDVRVTFPHSTPGEWRTVDTNGFYELRRDADTPLPWTPRN